jgi:hypothetical protein
MEDVLSVYERPYDPKRPVVCVDESNKALHDTPQGVLPLKPGQVQGVDYEYERNGTANIFMAVEPLVGKRYVSVTDRRTSQDFAEFLRQLSDEAYPHIHHRTLLIFGANFIVFTAKHAKNAKKTF